ncbi:MAG: hypothetical protein IPM82_31280 [Saprospiraceae bacterium]|nr:hypothetical protein [Saprospiraceae bacterium]
MQGKYLANILILAPWEAYSHTCFNILTIKLMLTKTMAEAAIVIQKKLVVDFDNLTFMVIDFGSNKIGACKLSRVILPGLINC